MRHARFVAGFCLVLLVPSGARAGVPSPATSIVPPLVGCPAGDLSLRVLVRDVASNPVVGSTVILSFGSCPSFSPCSGSFPGYVWNPDVRTATALTDSVGGATFAIHQGGVCSSVSVSADGVPLATRAFASADQNGDLQVDFTDVSIALAKLGTSDATADFNGNSFVDSLDVGVVQSHSGHNCGGTSGLGANAGPDITAECAGPAGTPVRLDGTASQGTSLTFSWSAPGITFDDPHSATPTGVFPLGTTAVLLEIQSDQGPSQDEVLVTVRDTKGPVLGVTLTPSLLWPPDGRLVPIHATVGAYDSCDTAPPILTLFSITVMNGDSSIVAPGDDVQGASLGTADFDFALRAVRVQGGSRTYTVCYQARDVSGNATEVCKNVVVARSAQAQFLDGPSAEVQEAIAFGVKITPNPVSTRATLVYSVPQQERVRLRVFDVSGRVVATLVDGVVTAGGHTASFDAVRKAGAHVFFYTLEAGNRRASGKFVLVK